MLRAAVELGITHIDTSDFYGPTVVNKLIKEALHPYPAGLHIVTKVGVRRSATGGWITSLDPADLKAQVYENLRHLGLETLDVVNLRTAAFDGDGSSIAEPFGTLSWAESSFSLPAPVTRTFPRTRRQHCAPARFAQT